MPHGGSPPCFPLQENSSLSLHSFRLTQGLSGLVKSRSSDCCSSYLWEQRRGSSCPPNLLKTMVTLVSGKHGNLSSGFTPLGPPEELSQGKVYRWSVCQEKFSQEIFNPGCFRVIFLQSSKFCSGRKPKHLYIFGFYWGTAILLLQTYK